MAGAMLEEKTDGKTEVATTPNKGTNENGKF